MKTTAIKKKKVQDMLAFIQYNGEMTYEDVAEWLMQEHSLFVMPIPMNNFKWEVGIVILGKPNTQDQKLNRFSVADGCKSLGDAVKLGVEKTVKLLYDGQKEALKHYGDEKYNERILESLREDGFDV